MFLEPAYYSFVHSVWPKKKCLLLTTSRWKNVSPVTNASVPSGPLELLLLGGCLFEIISLISSIFAYSTFYTKKRKHQLEAKNLPCREKPILRTVRIDYYLEHLTGTTSLEKCEVRGVHFARLCLELWIPTNAGSCAFARNAPYIRQLTIDNTHHTKRYINLSVSIISSSISLLANVTLSLLSTYTNTAPTSICKMTSKIHH